MPDRITAAFPALPMGATDGNDTPAPFQAPQHWLPVGKYLFPIGKGAPLRRPTKAPRQQVPVAELASQHPGSVSLQILGKQEVLPEFAYECHSFGERETRYLPTRFVAPAYLARLQNGLSFGRHCCVIGPDGQAVRETGFNLDGEVLLERAPISRYRLQYWRKRWEGDVTSRPWLPPRQRIDGRVAVLNTRFSHNFYHWMIDILPRLVPLRRAGVQADYYLVDCRSPFQKKVLAALGIQEEQLIQPHCRLLLEAEQLLVPSLPTPACLRDLGGWLSAGLGIDGPVRTSRRIFISRRKTGSRTLANEAELEALLLARGFETHSMQDYTLARQARLIREAEIVVATHGAGLANLLFARPGTRVVEIMPAGRYNATCYPEKSRVFGLHHQLLFAERARHKQILKVSIPDVQAALNTAMEGAEELSAAA